MRDAEMNYRIDGPYTILKASSAIDRLLVPIAYRINEKRWDGFESFLIRMSTGEVVERWHHPSEHAPYYHFGHSDELKQPPRYDETIARTK